MELKLTVFGDLKIGDCFTFDIGGNNWTVDIWRKVGPFDAICERKGRNTSISFWTKVRPADRPLVETL